MTTDNLLSRDIAWMEQALGQADRAAKLGEVPVGAVLVREQQAIAAGCNQPITTQDPTAHAEIVTLRKAASSLGNYRLPGTTLYVTIEPCTMCVGALIHARVERIVFGAAEPRAGAICSHLQLLDQPHYNHRIEWTGGILERECSELLTTFFRERRRRKNSE